MTPVYQSIPAKSDTPLFIFGDHASRFIPPEFDNLKLTGDDLIRHIAWDIGTETIIRRLCAHYQCGGLMAGVSRLVIDMNRAPEAEGIIPETSDGTKILGNHNLTADDIQNRIQKFHHPYHSKLGQSVKAIADSLTDPLIVVIHSFTQKCVSGISRETDIGLLVKHDFETAERFIAILQKLKPNYQIEINQPYSAFEFNYTVDRNVEPTGLRHLAIEVCQSHLDSKANSVAMADILAKAITPLLRMKNK